MITEFYDKKLKNDSMELIEYRKTVEFCVESMKQLAKMFKKEVAIKYELSTEVFIICSNETKLKRIIFNLLSNSFKNTLTGFIKVVTEVNNKVLTLSVVDTGKGTNFTFTDFDSSVFIKNFLEDNEKGIGLDIVNSLVNEINGTGLVLLSEFGKGTTVSFDISLTDNTAEKLANNHEVKRNRKEFLKTGVERLVGSFKKSINKVKFEDPIIKKTIQSDKTVEYNEPFYLPKELLNAEEKALMCIEDQLRLNRETTKKGKLEKKTRIIIVNEVPNIAKIQKSLLVDFAKKHNHEVEVIVTKDGIEALYLIYLFENEVDLILSEEELGFIDRRNLFKLLRKKLGKKIHFCTTSGKTIEGVHSMRRPLSNEDLEEIRKILFS